MLPVLSATFRVRWLVFAILVAWAGGASLTFGREQQSTAADYRRIIAAYRSGDRAAVDRLSVFSPGALRAAADDAVDGSLAAEFSWPERRAAAILHTEVWHRYSRAERTGTGAVHLDLAFALLAAVRRAAPAQWTFVDRWCSTVAGMMLRSGDTAARDAFRARARAAFPVDEPRAAAVAAVALGIIAENAANTAGQPIVGRTTPVHVSEQERQSGWAEAAASYESARLADPRFLLADLRLGRVRILQERWADAVAPLERAREDDDPRVSYLAWLYLGSLAEWGDRFDDAERAYREALRRYPRGQSAPLALGQLLTRTGRDREALTLLTTNRALSLPASIVEPLWTLRLPPGTDARDYAPLFAELMVEILE